MSFNFASMKNMLSWALKAQIPRQYLKPVYISRLNSNLSSRNVKEDFEKDGKENFQNLSEETHDLNDQNGGELFEEAPGSFERCVNEVKLLGRIGGDPFVPANSERPFGSFRLYTTRKIMSSESGEFKVKKEWHNIVSFNPRLIDQMDRVLKEGQRVFISGKLIYRLDKVGERRANILLNDFIAVGE